MVFNAIGHLFDLWGRLSRLSVSALMLIDVNDVSLCSVMLKLFLGPATCSCRFCFWWLNLHAEVAHSTFLS